MARDPQEARRLALLEKQRARDLAELQEKREHIQKTNQVKLGADRFVSQNQDRESELKRQTVGLVKLEDFQRIRDSIDKAQTEEGIGTASKKKKRKPESKAKLSFGDDDDTSVADTDDPGAKKLKKNPAVDTSFLPDRVRELAEQRERAALRQEWEAQQRIIKDETVTITYSYWDGSGHRRTVDVKKGDTIAHFLEKCRLQWHELRGVAVDNLMYVKEDLIIPHHYTFYDFIVNKTRGKSGPLFSFEVREDVRLVSDASIETDESHAGKVMERAWYERHKHIFPASRWEIFDPEKTYGRHALKAQEKDEGAAK
ncbi:hypothetical protein SeMB42_g04852 [Synchytrium endobioticum]|uniref:FAM50A/XAP5 C-terminal domain-containing protein n=1 Tax=Synchytrium endobioticum TaxID=286115 RepID=A0A507CU76_9FUNG|nr:hypothetical protein SeLEV6574_g05459 [Synchytrium endobioticum]TPX43133.1 hypothetical protein SeMB42_g04852 [Synchytrium endobioticum]